MTLYFNEPDHTGHGYGPDSKEVSDQVQRMDGVLGKYSKVMELQVLELFFIVTRILLFSKPLIFYPYSRAHS